MAYLLDTNVFIDAAETYYASDICPEFWRWLPRESQIRSIKEVKDELLKGNDNLSRWVRTELPKDFFVRFHRKLTATCPKFPILL